MRTATPIVERDVELAQIASALDAAVAGTGALVVIEGPAGIGKTSLLTAARGLGEERGMSVQIARGAEIEREFPYGMVRQLFERTVTAAPDDKRDRVLAGSAAMAAAALGIEGAGSMRGTSSLGVPHALYWLTANMAESGPLLLLMDDAHWSDAASLRFAAYLARRIEGLPVCLAVASRPDEPGSDTETLAAIATDPFARLLQVPPLTEAAVAAVLTERLGNRGSAPGFATACLRVTGGNPLLLRELVTALETDEIQATDEGVERVSQLGPRAVSRSVLLRIGNLDPAVGRVARAVAVLGDDAPLRHAAAVAEVDVDTAADAVDQLARVDILERRRPLRFIHPIVREAVYADLAPAQRAAAHARAAAALREELASPEAVAAHLMVTDPARDPDIVESLRSAASVAVDRAAPETAARYLQRALDEPPADDVRAAVLAELGEAELLAGQSASAARHLEEAMTMMPGGPGRARVAAELARATLSSVDMPTTLRAYEAAIAAAKPHDPKLARELEGEMAATAWQDPSFIGPMMERVPEWSRLPGDSLAERSLLATAARLMVRRGTPAREWVAVARRCLPRGDLPGGEVVHASIALWTGVYALLLGDALDEAEAFLARGEDSGRRRGDVITLLPVMLYRGMIALRRGRPREAEADALDTIANTEATMLHPFAAPAMVAVLVEALVEQGRTDDAEATLADSGLLAEMPPIAAFSRLLYARVMLRLAQGRDEEALADALLVGERDEPAGMLNPYMPWRLAASTAQTRLGRLDDARALAAEHLDLARGLELPGMIGQALHGAARVADGATKRMALLEEAVEVLSATPLRGDYAAALCDLGAALRVAGRRNDALTPLREAHDITLACGQLALHERVVTELRAAGARPRARMHAGADSLTASERRVAEMAARGDTNKEIAQALFVTAKTVENHLGRVYQKLDVHSRAELAGALSDAA